MLPRSKKRVAIEASNLFGLLTSLRFRVEDAQSDDPWFNQVKLLAVENGPLDQFKETLEKIVAQISPSRKRDQVKSVLTWKFTKSDVDNAIKRMDRLTSLVQCALTQDLL
jgi:Holliday junction resolvase RusA-like endonuclease